MRILSITAQKPDSTGSGVYLTELVRGFDQMGEEQAVIAGVSRQDRIRMPEGVEVFPVYYESEELPFPVLGMSDEMPYKSTRYSDMTDEMTEQFMVAFRRQVRGVVKQFRPDIILCHHLYFLTAMVRELCPGTSVYGICHGSDLRQIKKNPWEREYILTQIRRLDGIFALHNEQKLDICSSYGCAGEQVYVIGTGYNSDIFHIDEMRKQAKRKGELRLIFAGKLSEKKGVMSLLRSMRYLQGTGKRISLALAGGYGNEEEYAWIRALAEECPCRVEFLGRLAQRELAAEMNRSDIFVLPSFYEGLPLVLVEAMACGLRAVCTDLPGVRSWLEENVPENGVVFVEPPQMMNEDEPVEEELPEFEMRLAQAIRKAEYALLPKREYLERISWDGLCGKLMRVWKGLDNWAL